MLPPVGFPAPLLLGICFGQRGVRRHDTCRNLKCDGMIVHALLTLTFYLDRRRASPNLLLPFHLDPKRIHVVQTRVWILEVDGKEASQTQRPLDEPSVPQETHTIFLCRGDVVAVRYAARADWYRGKGPDGEVEMRNNKISSPQIYLDGPCSNIRNHRSMCGFFKHQTRFCLPHYDLQDNDVIKQLLKLSH